MSSQQVGYKRSSILAHPRVKKFLGQGTKNEKSNLGKMRQIMKIEKENIIDSILELNQHAVKEARAKQNFWGFMQQKVVKEGDVDLIVWCLEKLLSLEAKAIKSGWEEDRLFEILSKFLVHFNRFSIRFKVFQLLVQVVELRLPDCPNAYGSAREQAELLCRVPLKNAASDVEDNSKFAKTGMVVSDDDSSSNDGSSSNDECDELDPVSQGPGSIKKQVVPRKNIFQTLVEFESKTSKGNSFLDYCSKKWSLPGENVVEAQSKYEEIKYQNKTNAKSQIDDGTATPLHDYLKASQLDNVVSTYTKLQQYVELLIAAFDWSPWYNSLMHASTRAESKWEDSLGVKASFKKEARKSKINLHSHACTFPFLIAVECEEQSSKENVTSMLIYLFDHARKVDHLLEPDKAQFWHLILIHYIFPVFYRTIDFSPTRFAKGIMQRGSSLSIKCYLKDVPSEFQRAVVNFLTSSLRQKSIAKIILYTERRMENILECFHMYLSNPNLVTESQASTILNLYHSWIISNHSPLNARSTSNKIERYVHNFVMQVCCVIENSVRFTTQKDTKGFETTFSVAMSLLQSIGSMDYIYTSEFQTSVRQLLRVIANLSKSSDGASEPLDIHHYSARSAFAVFKLMVLTKRIDFKSWVHVYSEMPKILVNAGAVKALGVVLVCLTRKLLKMSYRKHDIQVYDKASKQTVVGMQLSQKKKISPNSIQKKRGSRNNFYARLNFPTNLVTSFNANHLKYMFEPTDAAYKAMGREESQVNYWDDESNNFYEALNLAFSDDLEKCQSDIGVKETKVFSSSTNVANGSELADGGASSAPRRSSLYGRWANVAVSPAGHLFIIWDRLIHMFSCGKHCEVWKSPAFPDSFESIILQIVYLIRTWLRIQEQVAVTYKEGNKFKTPLVSTVIELFGPWLLNSCLHDLDDHFYDYSGKYEGGKAMAFSVLCCLISIQTEEVIPCGRLFEIYSCIGYGLSFPDKQDLSVIHSIIAHSMDIFSTGHDGVGTLIPSFLYAIDRIVNNESEKDYQKLSQHLRRSIVCILGSIFSHASLLENLGSAALVNTLLTRNLDKDHADTSVNNSKKVSQSLEVPIFKLRLAHCFSLLKKVLSMEKEPPVISQIVNTMTVIYRHEAYRTCVAGTPVHKQGADLFQNLNLKSVLYDDAMRQQLRGFSKKEYSDENIDFWVDVEKFRACTLTALDSNKASDKQVAIKIGKYIHETYIIKDAAREVNIPSKISDSMQALQYDNQNEHLIKISFFDEAQSEIYDLIDRDIYPRFVSEYINTHLNIRVYILDSMLQLIESAYDIYSGRKHTKENIPATLSVVEEALSSLTFIAYDFEPPKEEKESYSNEQVVETAKVVDCLTSTLSDCAQSLQRSENGLNRNPMWRIVQKVARALKSWVMLKNSLDEVENVLKLLHSIVKTNGKISQSETTGEVAVENRGESLSKKLSNNTEKIQAIYELRNTAAYIIRYFKADESTITSCCFLTTVTEVDLDGSKPIFFSLNRKIFSIAELPVVSRGCETCFSRVIMRDESGKFSWDFDYVRNATTCRNGAQLNMVLLDKKSISQILPKSSTAAHENSIANTKKQNYGVENHVQEMLDTIIEAVCRNNPDSNKHIYYEDILETYANQSIPKLSTKSNRLEDLLSFTIDRFDKNFEEEQSLENFYRMTSEYLQKHAEKREKLLQQIEELPIVGGDHDAKGEPAVATPNLDSYISHENIMSVTKFDRCRQLLADLGFIGSRQLGSFTPLKDGKRLRTFLRSLDRNNSRKTARIAVIYIGQGQTEQVEIMHNTKGSVAYDRFLLGLGDVRDVKDLKQQGRYIGGLDPQVHSSTIYYENSHVEVAYHVLTSLPLKENDKQQIRRKRHIGNDTVHIVWCDNKRAYDVRSFISKVTDVFIVLLPILPHHLVNEAAATCSKLLKVEIYCRNTAVQFGPLQDGMVIHANLAPALVRQTAINAVIAVRGEKQIPYQRRRALIDEILKKFEHPAHAIVHDVFGQ